MLSELKKAFRRDGMAIAANVPAAELDAVASDIRAVFARRARHIGLAVPAGDDHESFSELLLQLFAADQQSYLAAAKQTQYLASIHKFGVSDAIMDVLAALGLEAPAQSTRPVIHYMADGLKFEKGYHKTPPHQDWRSVQGSLDGVTFWIPLFDVGLDDYPLEVVPGSHHNGLLRSEDDAFGHKLVEGQVGDADFRAVPANKGELIVFSGFLVHRTGATGGRRVRTALSYRFNNAAEPSYVARNYPYPYSYRADMTPLQDGFPGLPDLAPFFGDKASRP